MGSLDSFDDFKDALSGHYMQVGAGYLFHESFQHEYLRDGLNCYINYPEEISNVYQLKQDIVSLYGALQSACKCWKAYLGCLLLVPFLVFNSIELALGFLSFLDVLLVLYSLCLLLLSLSLSLL